MNRETFMRELEYLLQDISEEERQEAIDYYESYFDEAGIDNEQQVIHELGDPSQVAAIIKDGLKGQFDDHIESGNHGFSNHDYQKNYEVVDVDKVQSNRFSYFFQQLKTKWHELDKKDKTILIVIFIIACLPISSLFAGISGGLLGIAFAFTVLFFGLWIITFVLYVIAIVMIVIGVLQFFHIPAVGFIILGMGCLILALAQIFEKLARLFFKNVVPAVVDGISKLCDNIFRKRGVKYENKV